jgi:hypothetical protein
MKRPPSVIAPLARSHPYDARIVRKGKERRLRRLFGPPVKHETIVPVVDGGSEPSGDRPGYLWRRMCIVQPSIFAVSQAASELPAIRARDDFKQTIFQKREAASTPRIGPYHLFSITSF